MTKPFLAWALVFSVGLFPVFAQASILSIFGVDPQPALAIDASANSQTLVLPQAQVTPATDPSTGSPQVAVDNDALLADAGPMGTTADVATDDTLTASDQISVYVVKAGDTLPVIADMFGVSVNTIIWANDLTRGQALTPGQTLVVLPISGISYTVKSGDTLSSIAKKFKADADEIGKYNGLEMDSTLSVGDTVIIPDAESDYSSGTTRNTFDTQSASVSNSVTSSNNASSVSPSGNLVMPTGLPADEKSLPLYGYGATRYVPHKGDDIDLGTYFMRPVGGLSIGCIETQGLHGYDAVDIGCPKNTPIHAAAAGVVIIAKDLGWNGGYGKYVAIKHPNGTETVYGHMNKVEVTVGEIVSQGEEIGKVGRTGQATGYHVHWEVRGAMNPMGNNPDYGL